MTRILHTTLSMLLVITTLAFGTGVDVIRCAHSGMVMVMPSWHDAMTGMDCDPDSDCMAVQHVQLSPLGQVQAIDHVQAPVLLAATVPCTLIPQWLLTLPVLPPAPHAYRGFINPPRAYLNLIRVLLI